VPPAGSDKPGSPKSPWPPSEESDSAKDQIEGSDHEMQDVAPNVDLLSLDKAKKQKAKRVKAAKAAKEKKEVENKKDTKVCDTVYHVECLLNTLIEEQGNTVDCRQEGMLYKTFKISI
jgi:hypothetical protein